MEKTYIAFVLADTYFTFGAASLPSPSDCMKAVSELIQATVDKGATIKAFGCMEGQAKLLWGLK